MERALRVISVERGYDPVGFAVVAFGGAGGLHVAELTARLGARSAIVPPDPGLLSAYGMLASPLTREASRTVLVASDASGADARLAEGFAELEAAARAELIEEGAQSEALTAEKWIDARYRGQSFELAVPADGWVERFHTSHLERYGYRRSEAQVEAVTLRVVVTAEMPELHPPELPEAKGPPELEAAEVQHGGRRVAAHRVWRGELRAGHELAGPLVVQEYSGTTWVPPEWQLRVDRWGCLHLTPG
jgi:N-methylhydantoinase A